MRITYTTSDGEAFDLSGRPYTGITGDDPKGWKLEASGHAYLPAKREFKATVQAVGSKQATRRALDRMLDKCDRDAREETPGRLSYGEWYIDCYVIEGDCNELGGNAVYELTFAAPDPAWKRDVLHRFFPASGSAAVELGVDYPHDYPHDYGAKATGETLAIDTVGECDLRIVIYGPAVSPYVRIGGNVYQVDVTVPDGGLLTIDSARKASMAGDAVVLRDRFGNATDVFNKRRRGYEGSGNYIFQRIAPGEDIGVSWPQSFGFDLHVIERRGRLPWTWC